MIRQIKQLYELQEQTMEELKRSQHTELKIRYDIFVGGKQELLPLSRERCSHLMNEHDKLLKQVRRIHINYLLSQQSLELQRLSEIIKTLVLDSSTLHTVRSLILSLQLQAQQLALLREELLEDMKAESSGTYPGLTDPLGLRYVVFRYNSDFLARGALYLPSNHSRM